MERDPQPALNTTQKVRTRRMTEADEDELLYDDVDVKPMQVKKNEVAAPVVTPLGT